jgi:hypothetical protein
MPPHRLSGQPRCPNYCAERMLTIGKLTLTGHGTPFAEISDVEQIVPTPEATASRNMADQPRDRRHYHRLDMRLPVEVLPVGVAPAAPIRTTTRNVSAGGIYFEAPADVLEAGGEVHLSLSVPPGAGYFPYAGRGTGIAEVVRLDPIGPEGHGHARVGVAARFSQPLKFVF